MTNKHGASHTPTIHTPIIVPGPLVRLLTRLLRPLVRLLLRQGVSCLEFEEISRWVFVDVALNDTGLALPGRRRPFKSRAAILTGLSRKEVMRLAGLPSPDERAAIPSRNRAARVMMGWLTHNEFEDEDGRPRELPISRGSVSFAELVRRFGGDVPHRAILDELLQNGLAERVPGERLRLTTAATETATFNTRQVDTAASLGGLLATLDHNQNVNAETARLPEHCLAPVTVPASRLEEVREFIRGEIETFSQRIGSYLGEHHVAADTAESVRPVGCGMYYFED